MKITGINIYKQDLPLTEESYNWSDGKAQSVFDTTVVELITDSGLKGYGEVCPLGSNYLPSYANGVRGGIKELAPDLLGLNPLEIGVINDVMDYKLKGHPYVKSPIDMACWDLLGKHCKLPVCTLLGGRFGEHVELYRAISMNSPEATARNVQAYRSGGYHKFQLKLGGKIQEDIERIQQVRGILSSEDTLVGDANTGWLSHEAIKIAGAVADLDVYIEQPCLTYEECLRVRQHTNLPFILDENINSLDSVMRAHNDKAADVINLKISKFGGITKLKQARDLCVSFGLAMTIEDSWGSDIVTAAITHLAHSTPVKYRFSSTDFNSYNTVHIASGVSEKVQGKIQASTEPGLGVTPTWDVLGKSVFSV